MSKPIEVNTNLYRRLKENGIRFNNIIDVGCYKGSWTSKLKLIYPDANYYLIDPNDKYKEKLKLLGTFYQEVVGQQKEEREFNFSKNELEETGNSLYDENSNIEFNKKTIMVKPLKDIVPNQTYDLIKMDVQGAELEIIEGSLPLFTKTKWVQLECPIHPNNKGAPNFAQIINYMTNSGFETFDIENIFYNGKLMCIDFLFNNITLPQVTALESKIIEYKIN